MATAKGQLHPSVQKFKQFVRHHPKMAQAVRNGEKTWQQFYEEWYLLGEQDEAWSMYKDGAVETKQAAAQASTVQEEAKKDDVVGQVISFLKNMNMEQVQYHLANVTNVIGSVQQVVQSFKGESSPQAKQPPTQNNPFFFQKD